MNDEKAENPAAALPLLEDDMERERDTIEGVWSVNIT